MSLINDMLRDLEDKRPDDLARHNLQREIRPLPGDGRRAGRLRLALLLGAGAVLLAAALLQAGGHLGGLFDGAPPAAPAAPPVAAQPLTDSPLSPAVGPPASAAVDSKIGPISENMRLASELANVPAQVAPAPAAPETVAAPVAGSPPSIAPAAPPVAVAKVEPPPAASQPAQVLPPAALASPVAPAGPAKIEKSPVLATPRDRAEAEFRKAEAARSAGHGAEAVDGWRAALKIDPGFAPARQALLRDLLDNRRTEEAMAVLQAGLNEQPGQSAWAMALARLQLEAGDLAAADRTLARSQPYAEGSAEYAGFQGHLKSRLGAHSMAVGHYQRATRLAPGEGRWWLGLGLALEADGQLPAAKEAFRRSRETGSLSPDLAAIADQHLR